MFRKGELRKEGIRAPARKGGSLSRKEEKEEMSISI
jgi:hypothetical protein